MSEKKPKIIRILLIENSKDYHAELPRLLNASHPGATQVVCAGCIEEAIGMLGSETYDVIIVDIELYHCPPDEKEFIQLRVALDYHGISIWHYLTQTGQKRNFKRKKLFLSNMNELLVTPFIEKYVPKPYVFENKKLGTTKTCLFIIRWLIQNQILNKK